MERQGLRSHLSGSVPISIAAHLIAITFFVVIPLTAVDVSMIVHTDLPDYIRAMPVPPPPEVMRTSRRPTSTTPRSDASHVPTTAGTTIAPEVEPPGLVTDAGVPDIGTAVGDPVGIAVAGRPTAVTPPPPARQAGPVRVADLPVPPQKIVDVRPVYPDIARQARQQGIVVMEAVLDPTGSVTQLRVIRSVPLLDQAALDAVRRWKYTPTMYGGHPVSVLMTITIRFTLH